MYVSRVATLLMVCNILHIWSVYLLIAVTIVIGAIAVLGGFPNPGRITYVTNVTCGGSESSLFECSHAMSRFFCDPRFVAGVFCQGKQILHV